MARIIEAADARAMVVLIEDWMDRPGDEAATLAQEEDWARQVEHPN